MITGLTIQNFRGFRDMTLEGLARVNLLVGDNGSGKTALLEAIDLAASNTILSALALRRARGLPSRASTVELVLHSDFAGNDGDATIALRLADRTIRSLRIFLDKREPVPVDPLLPSDPQTVLHDRQTIEEATRGRVTFEWKNGEAVRGVSRFNLTGSVLGAAPADIELLPATYLSPTEVRWPDSASVFSEYVKAGDATEILEAMKKQFPDLSGFSVQLEGSFPLLHARFGDRGRLRPLNALSAGLTKLTSMMMMIAAPAIRIVLIDEIENGLHHARFRLLWQQVRDFAARFDTQVFATTHSLECLDAAADAMSEHPDDFALMRTVRTEDKGCLVGILPGMEARHLLRSGLEVRG
jgi:energy-coupling factor transporter ATP-binding protein EcfA2